MNAPAEDLEDIILIKEEVPDFDPVMLSYELEKLSLENNPRDIFDKDLDEKKLTVPIVKSEIDSDTENDDKIELSSCVIKQKCSIDVNILKVYLKNEEGEAAHDSQQDDSGIFLTSPNTETCEESDILKNRELPFDANNLDITDYDDDSKSSLPQKFEKLDVSDSENEEGFCELRERKPERIRRLKRGAQGQFVKSREIYDFSSINRDKLRSLSGGKIITTEKNILSYYPVPNIPTLPSPPLPDECSLYGTSTINSVPDSGYATSPSSSRSDASSPPLSPSLDEFQTPILDDGMFTDLASKIDLPTAPAFESVKESLDFFIKEIPVIDCIKEPPVLSAKKLSCSPPNKTLICKPINDEAKKRLYQELNEERYIFERNTIYRKVNDDGERRKEVKIIYVEDEDEKLSKNQTNLHLAVLESNKEKIFSIVEIHKHYRKPFSDINLRDKSGKTALDYAIQNNMTSVAAYLEENLGCRSVDI